MHRLALNHRMTNKIRRQMEGFKKVREVLGFGRQTPSENAARIILETAEKN